MGPKPEFIDGCRVLAYANVPDSVPFTGRLRLNVDGRWLGRVPNLAVGIADAGEFVVLHCDAEWESLGIGGWNAPGVVEPASMDDVIGIMERYYEGLAPCWIRCAGIAC